MTDDLLARIDAAVDGRCACGCGTLLDPSGPSGWWAAEGCQRRWQSRGAAKPADAPAMITTDGRSTPAEGERMDAGSTVDARTISADHPSSPAVVPPLACRWCPVEQRGHGWRWTRYIGMHNWVEPAREQITDRMRTNIDTTGRIHPDGITPGLATGGPLPADGDPVLLGESGCGLTLDIDTSALRSITITPPDPETIMAAMRDALRRPPTVLPYAPEERVRVARIEMHPDLIAQLVERGEARAEAGPGLLGVPITPDDTLPPGGWRSYDHDGQIIGQHPTAAPAGRPRPAPRPPWWRRWLDRLCHRWHRHDPIECWCELNPDHAPKEH